MTERKAEGARSAPEEYVQRVTAFLNDARAWCGAHSLTLEDGVVTLKEELLVAYEAPSLRISKDGALLAQMLPVGSKIIGAQGRVDLIGRFSRHRLLFHVGKGPAFSAPTNVSGKTRSSPSASRLSGVAEDGWYWIEASIRRPKLVDESLFLDLLTDVSDYEF